MGGNAVKDFRMRNQKVSLSSYAEGVVFHSPGSRRGEAAERTLGYGPHTTRIRRRRYTNDDNADTIAKRHNHVAVV